MTRNAGYANGSPAIGALFAGRLDDGGFMEYGHRGLERAKSEFGLTATVIDQVPPDPNHLAEALRSLAHGRAKLVVAHGGQNDRAASEVAAEFPDVRFAVTQGSVRGPNLASYEVRQEQSAFLAGVAAARLSASGIVGHISGIRVRPGLLGRAAFAAGVAAANPEVRLLTTFCGTQDDSAVAKRVTAAQLAAGADIIFTMLNAAIDGAVAACHGRRVRLIGNVRDWVAVNSGVFIGSAIADVGIGVYEACREYAQGSWQANRIHRIGVEEPAAVRLLLAADAPREVSVLVSEWCSRLAQGLIEPSEEFQGDEFEA